VTVPAFIGGTQIIGEQVELVIIMALQSVPPGWPHYSR
jgi:hypothetical protein